jgi:hypothetical protein
MFMALKFCKLLPMDKYYIYAKELWWLLTFDQDTGQRVKIDRFSKQKTGSKVIFFISATLGLEELFVANRKSSRIKETASKSVKRVQSYRGSKITIA